MLINVLAEIVLYKLALKRGKGKYVLLVVAFFSAVKAFCTD